MKKLIKIIMAAVFAAAVLTSCGKRDITVYDIEGTWENVIEGSTVTTTCVYTFRTDMTYIDSSVSSSEILSLGSEDEGTYSLSGSFITLTDSWGGSNTFEVSFDGDTMIFTTEEGVERIFTRK